MKKQSCLILMIMMKEKKGSVVKRKFIFLLLLHAIRSKQVLESACLFKPFQATITHPCYRTSVRIQRISGMLTSIGNSIMLSDDEEMYNLEISISRLRLIMLILIDSLYVIIYRFSPIII